MEFNLTLDDLQLIGLPLWFTNLVYQIYKKINSLFLELKKSCEILMETAFEGLNFYSIKSSRIGLKTSISSPASVQTAP